MSARFQDVETHGIAKLVSRDEICLNTNILVDVFFPLSISKTGEDMAIILVPYWMNTITIYL